MKCFFAISALFAAVMAAPAVGDACTPATYTCAQNPSTGAEGWEVCDVSGAWVWGGDCPPDTKCVFLQVTGSPYCIPN